MNLSSVVAKEQVLRACGREGTDLIYPPCGQVPVHPSLQIGTWGNSADDQGPQRAVPRAVTPYPGDLPRSRESSTPEFDLENGTQACLPPSLSHPPQASPQASPHLWSRTWKGSKGHSPFPCGNPTLVRSIPGARGALDASCFIDMHTPSLARAGCFYAWAQSGRSQLV